MFLKYGASLLVLVSSSSSLSLSMSTPRVLGHTKFEGIEVLITFGSVLSANLLGTLVTLAENTSAQDKQRVVTVLGENDRPYKTTVDADFTYLVSIKLVSSLVHTINKT